MPYKIQILAMLCFPFALHAQTGKLSLTLSQTAELTNSRNPSLQMVGRAVGITRSERKKMNVSGILYVVASLRLIKNNSL